MEVFQKNHGDQLSTVLTKRPEVIGLKLLLGRWRLNLKIRNKWKERIVKALGYYWRNGEIPVTGSC